LFSTGNLPVLVGVLCAGVALSPTLAAEDSETPNF
jgi:hypothetical protein